MYMAKLLKISFQFVEIVGGEITIYQIFINIYKYLSVTMYEAISD